MLFKEKDPIYLPIPTNYVLTQFIFLGFKYFSIKKNFKRVVL